MTTVKSKVMDHFTLFIDKEDGSEPQTWKLCYDYRAIAKAEDKTGLDLKKIEDWGKVVASKNFPTVVWCGLNKFNPDVTLDEVLDVLNPTAQRMLSDEILELIFPGTKAAYEKFLQEKATGATASPNAQVGTPSV